MTDLTELKKLAREATPGPWFTDHNFGHATLVKGSQRFPIAATHMAPHGEANKRREEANAAFIAASNPETVLSLIAEIERLEAENARLKDTVATTIIAGEYQFGDPEGRALAARTFPVEWAEAEAMTGRSRNKRLAKLRKLAVELARAAP